MIDTLLQGRRTTGLTLLVVLGFATGAGAQATPMPGPASAAPLNQVTIPADVPLRIAITRRARLKLGEPVQGELLQPIYVGTTLVLPAHALVAGHIAETPPVDRATRRNALLETAFDAPLRTPLVVPVAPTPEVEDAPSDAMLREAPIVEARLTEDVSSDTAKNGDPVHAVLTQPAFDHQHRLLFPEGASLTGVVLRAKPSRSLGRNGALRFAFRSMQPVAGAAELLQGQVTGAEGQQKAGVTVDEEGGTHANPAPDRFLGPLVLAVLAAGGTDEDGGAVRQGTASNGLGIVVRLVTVASGSGQFAVAVGAYGFAKSVYRHFLAHGQPVSFPKNTALEVQLSQRR